jgi:heme-binding protein
MMPDAPSQRDALVAKACSMRRALLMGLGVLVAIQFVPVTRDNGPGTVDAVGAPPEVTALLRRACTDCHTGATAWPWYSHVAPVSWLVVHDVHEGREDLEFAMLPAATPAKKAKLFGKIVEEVEEGGMPLRSYRWLHPDARLTDAERKAIVDWANAAEDAALAQ